MAFPWKKVKCTKISQLINDHLHHSQKRRDGSSLVVETGFPTSLVDLFIKNREKLKKPSKKKRDRNPPTTPADLEFPATRGSSTPIPISVTAESPLRPLCHPSPRRSIAPFLSEGTNDIVLLDVPDGEERECAVERSVDAKGVLFGVLKMFLVVVVALGTKRLTLGITLSAFLLFFLEYVGQYVCILFKPCSEAKGMLKLMVKRVRGLLRLKNDKLDEENDCVVLQQEGFLKSRCDSATSSISRCSEQDIQKLEPKGYSVNQGEGIWYEKEILVDKSLEERRGYQEIETIERVRTGDESGCELGESKKRKSRREKIKSKIKKIVPKKLRSSRKEQRNGEPVNKIEEEKDLSLRAEKDVGESNDGWEMESTSNLSLIPGGGYKEENGVGAICALGSVNPVSEVDEDSVTNKEGEECEEGVGELTWRPLALALIVLIGLIGGRAAALSLTVLWFLVLKYGEILPKCRRAPPIIIRSLLNAKCG